MICGAETDIVHVDLVVDGKGGYGEVHMVSIILTRY
jgi:hypothetical protein